MNAKFVTTLLSALTVAVLAAGCVDTVSGRKTGGVPFVTDKKEQRYDRSVDEVFQAAKSVIQEKGVLARAGELYNQTNSVSGMAKIVEGKVNQCNVWVRVYPVEPKVTSVTVQTRTPGGSPDMDLAYDIHTAILLKLVR